MFEVITTGKNKWYGEKGQKRKLNDSLMISALKEGWIEPQFKYLGDTKWYAGKGRVKHKKVPILPEQPVYILKELEIQTRTLERIEKELKFVQKKMKLIKDLFKNAKTKSK